MTTLSRKTSKFAQLISLNDNSANTLSISSGSIIVSGSLSISSGSVSNPSLVILNDTDTGIWSSGNNQLSIATSGTNRLTINEFGQILIGNNNLNGNGVLIISAPINGGAGAYGIINSGEIGPNATINGQYFTSRSNVSSSGVPTVVHFNAAQGQTTYAGPVVTQYGFLASQSLVGASNNYGFYSDIDSGNNRYNFYAGGTATNYFGGRVGINITSPLYHLDVSGSGRFNSLNINSRYTFPTGDGTANQILQTDGNGNLSWTTQAAGGSSLSGTMLNAVSSGIAIGYSGWIYQSGQVVLSQGSFGGSVGDAQNSTYLLRTTSTDANWYPLLNNGQSGILLASNRTFQFGVNIVARRTDSQDNAAYKLEGLLYNDGYGCSIVGNPIKTVFGESDSSWDVRARIDSSGNSNFLFIEGYGANSKIIHWVAKADLLEVGGNIDGYTKVNILNTKINTIP